MNGPDPAALRRGREAQQRSAQQTLEPRATERSGAAMPRAPVAGTAGALGQRHSPSPPQMKLGINVRSATRDSYGIDFGSPFRRGRTAAWLHEEPGRSSEAGRIFDACRAAGVRVIRWWIATDGERLLPQPTPAGRGSYAVGRPARVTQELLDDYEALLALTRRKGMQLMPCLVSFGLCGTGKAKSHPVPGATGAPPVLGVEGGRHAWITDSASRADLVANVIEPLLAITASYRDVIYAVDVMNEPDQVFNLGTEVPAAALRAFLDQSLRRVAGWRLPGTCGWSAPPPLGGWEDSLPVAIEQYHVYDDPPVALLPPLPTCLGEMPFRHDHFAAPGETPARHDFTWSTVPRLRTHDLAQRLAQLNRDGFDSAFLWRYTAPSEQPSPTEAGWASQRNRALMAAYARGDSSPDAATRLP